MNGRSAAGLGVELEAAAHSATRSVTDEAPAFRRGARIEALAVVE